METLLYRIENCLEQAKNIKAEYPNVDFVAFNFKDCNYEEMKSCGLKFDRPVNIIHGCGNLSISSPEAMITIESTPLVFETKQEVEG